MALREDAMTSMTKSMPAQSIVGGSATDSETRRQWSPPRLRRLATSNARNSPGPGPDAEVIS
jgi:hypothetical protein